MFGGYFYTANTKMMRKILLLLLFLPIYLTGYSGNSEKYLLTRQQIEERFLANNLSLIAEKLNVEVAEAAVIQAKLWENPSVTIGDVNLWSTRSQRDGENIPGFIGDFGKNTEFSIELSQLIYPAGKRRKLIAVENAAKEIVESEFEEWLLVIKFELRNAIQDALYLQEVLELYREQLLSVEILVNSFTGMVADGNFSANELLRLKTVKLSLEKDIYETEKEWNEVQRILKSLLVFDPECDIIIRDEKPTIITNLPDVKALVELAYDNRPDLGTHNRQGDYYERLLKYERYLRAPDVTFGVNYDRWGGVWRNYVGFGVGVDIPIFNRNQGNIKAAKIGMRKNDLLFEQKKNEVANEIAESYKNYLSAVNFYNNVAKDDFSKHMYGMLERYKSNLLSRNIGMIEYIDFWEAYRESEEINLESRMNLEKSYNELCLTVGVELK